MSDPFFSLLKLSGSGRDAPREWEPWLRALFPRYVSTFAPHHADYWRYVWGIREADTPDPFVAIWARGGGKTTSAELGVAALGLRGARKYVLYVRDTQDRADDSVGNIAAMLESDAVAEYYPRHAEPLVGKHGNSRGWRRNRLRTSGGFTVDAIGLDVAARGTKLDEQRPDLIVIDDVDGKLDSATTTEKKIQTITTSIFPAGAPNVAILCIQNLIIPDGFFSRMVDGRADYLANRVVSGPHPAVRDLVVDYEEGEGGTRRAIIVGGTPTWAGQNLATCQKQVDDWGLTAFQKEAQHDVKGTREGVALNWIPSEHSITMTDQDVVSLIRSGGTVFGGIDFGAWRFAFTLWAVRLDGVVIRVDEYFSQRKGESGEPVDLSMRARALTDLCAKYGIHSRILIWGDAANPTDITELNAAWVRQSSPLRVVPVGMENKTRITSVERLNRLLGTRMIRFRALPPYRWRLGWNASSQGVEMSESRLEWEMAHWSYPIPQAGHSQSQDPDDHTADGADLISSARYAIMSWWKPGAIPNEDDGERQGVSPGYDYDKHKPKERQSADEYVSQTFQRAQAGRSAVPFGRMKVPRR